MHRRNLIDRAAEREEPWAIIQQAVDEGNPFARALQTAMPEERLQLLLHAAENGEQWALRVQAVEQAQNSLLRSLSSFRIG